MEITWQSMTWGLLLAGSLVCAAVSAQSPINTEPPAAEVIPATVQPATVQPGKVQPAEVQPLAGALEQIRSQFDLPGLAAGVVSRHGLDESAAVGVRKMGSPTAVTASDLWHLGSCTKSLTATLLAVLVQERLLTWETTLAELFPDMAADMDEDFREINVEHLLTHRSGLPANGPWWDLGRERTPTEQRLELLRRMSAQPLKHAPGSRYEYSNVGYALAGLMAETVLQQTWEVALWERVLKPLKVQSNQIGFGIPGTLGEVDQPWGHRSSWLGLGPLVAVQLDNAPSLGPAGTMHASLDAWAKFIALHLDRQQPLLREELWDKLHTPPAESEYALGWTVLERSWANGSSEQGRALTHAGSNTVNYCVCWLAPERGFAVIAVTNSGQVNAAEALNQVSALLIKRAVARLADGSSRQ